MSVVVDASVAVKLFVQEEGADRVEALFAETQALFAPRIIAAETAATLTKKVRRGEMEQKDAEQTVASFLSMLTAGIIVVHPDEDLLPAATGLSLRLHHAVYDCLYLALAMKIGGRLITADHRFEQKLKKQGFPSHIIEF